MQPAPVEFVEGGLQQVDGVAELARQVVGDGASAQGRDAGGQRGVGEGLLRPLEVPPGVGEFTGVQGRLAEPQLGGGLDVDEVVPLGLGEQRGVQLGGPLGLAAGERALGLGEPEPEVGGEPGGAPGGQFLVRHPEPLGDVPERLVGGAHPAGFEGGDVGGGVGGLGELLLRQSAGGPQLLHPSADDLRFVAVRHPNSPWPSCC